MDYLNYGKKDQQKQQGFDNQVQLTKDDFNFGDLSQQEAPPQATPQIQDELIQLFPTPLLICPCPFDYSMELEWINKQSTGKKNISGNDSKIYNHQSEDTFILDNSEMSRVRQFIELKIKEFAVNVMGSDSEMVITQSWLNKNMKGESHHEHEHPNSIISGVWYPKIHEQLPPICFRQNNPRGVILSIKNRNNFNSSKFLLPLKMGELILFPSNLAHSVPSNHLDEERISLSFNTWAKGNLGDIKALTFLPIDRCV